MIVMQFVSMPSNGYFFLSTTQWLDRLKGIPLSDDVIERAKSKGRLEQRGVLRTNCLDCLDRTNAAQVRSHYVIINIYNTYNILCYRLHEFNFE